MDSGALGLLETLLLTLDQDRAVTRNASALPSELAAALAVELSPVGRLAAPCAAASGTHQGRGDDLADELRARAGTAMRKVREGGHRFLLRPIREHFDGIRRAY